MSPITPAEIKALVERLEKNEPLPICPYDSRSPEYWTTNDTDPCKFCGSKNEEGAPDLCRGADTRLFAEAATALRYFMDGGWRPIAEYEGCGPALVSSAPESRRELFSEPVSAFRDVTGVWRCLGSIGGMAELARQPTHFRPLPTPPAVEGEAGE